MNTRNLLIALTTVAASFGAMAQEATVEPKPVISSAVTRADVHREAVLALAQQSQVEGEASLAPKPMISNAITRAEVHREAVLALAQQSQVEGEATVDTVNTTQRSNQRVASTVVASMK